MTMLFFQWFTACFLISGSFFTQHLMAEVPAMSTSQDRFAAANQAMSSGDWESAVKIQESMVGDGIITVPLLTNLALARLKQNDLPQSVAAWLAARSLAPQTPVVQEGLASTLAAVHLGMEALDLSAHGPLTAWLAEQTIADVQWFIYAAMASLVLSVLIIAMTVFNSKNRTRWLSAATSALAPSLIVTALLWAASVWMYQRLGTWGAVTDHQGAALRETPHETATEQTRIKLGTPVFVTGDTYSRWLDIRTSDGHHGYVDSLQVRVIRTH